MIFDNIMNASKYYNIDEKIKRGLLFLTNTDLKSLKEGKYIINDDIYVNIEKYKPKSIDNCFCESHKKYIDIQFIIEGEELFGFANLDNINLNPISVYDESKDIIFYDGDCDYLKLKENDFIILDINFAHKPQIATNNCDYVKKAVVKIRK